MLKCLAILTAFTLGFAATSAQAASRVEAIQKRGSLTCGVWSHVAGFSQMDAKGNYSGLDVDICRAVAAAILGSPDKVRFVEAETLQGFLFTDEIDIVSRRLSWEIRREGMSGLRFGPIMFYDGQGFLVPKSSGAKTLNDIAAKRICVEPREVAEVNLVAYFRAHNLPLKTQLVGLDQVGAAFAKSDCDAYTTDVSELAALRSALPHPEAFDILDEEISKEPLAQLIRQGDDRFFDVLRWTIFALIEAEEAGVTSKNIDAMLASDDTRIKRLLGVIPGNGRALGLDERWAYRIIKTLGNYGEMYDRNVGRNSPIKLKRGLNRLWSDGGLMYAPPLR